MSERVRTFAPGEKAVIALEFEYEGDGEIKSVEAVFAREGSGEEIVFIGDAKKEASGDRVASYAARLEGRIAPNADPGEYRCVRLSSYDQLDDAWDFSEIARLDLVVRVERAPRRLEVTMSEFL